MKNKLILLPVLVLTSGVMACNQTTNTSSIEPSSVTPSSSEEKTYFVVSFNYNTENNKENYLNLIVNKGQVLDMPSDPTLEDLVFEGWYKEATCENKYLRWGLEIDSDFTLYANWTKYADLDIETKVSKFQAALKELGKDASQVNQSCSATVAYPFMGEDAVFNVNDKYVYKRYNTLTEKDYYQVQEDGSTTLYGKEQFRYDDKYFYDVYVDYEDSTQNETSKSAFDKNKIETFISIDFQNLFHTCENNFVYYSKQPGYDEDTFGYTFTGNYTKLNKNVVSYSYSEGYYNSQYSDSAGDYVTLQYAYNFGLIFENGRITRANVESQFLYAIGSSEVYQYNIETSVYDFYYNNGQFADFTGTLL